MTKSSLQLEVEWKVPITLSALAQRFFEEGFGKKALEGILLQRSDELVTALCGPRYFPYKDGRYRRAGTKKRKLVTRLGKITIKVHRVRDIHTGDIFFPLWNEVLIEPYKVYQPDVIALAEKGVIKMTYRDTREIMNEVVDSFPSPQTINRYIRTDGMALSNEYEGREIVAEVHQPDSTKLHAQCGGKHDLKIVLGTSGDKPPLIRCISAGKSWHDHIPAFNKTTFQKHNGNKTPPVVVSDMETGLGEVITPDGGYWQPCILHVIRQVSYSLWKDDMAMGKEKKRIIRTAKKILFHLINSVDHYLPRGQIEPIEHRIKQTEKELRRLSSQLVKEGYYKTASFLRKISNYVTAFATLSLKGINVPWHNNLVERLMGEISKRCKHKWMSWTEQGAQGLITLLVTKIIEPEQYEKFYNRKVYHQEERLPDLGVKITQIGG